MLIVGGQDITVEDVSHARLACADQQARNSSRLIRQQHDPARAKIEIIIAEIFLVVGREIIRNREPACSRKLQKTARVLCAV